MIHVVIYKILTNHGEIFQEAENSPDCFIVFRKWLFQLPKSQRRRCKHNIKKNTQGKRFCLPQTENVNSCRSASGKAKIFGTTVIEHKSKWTCRERWHHAMVGLRFFFTCAEFCHVPKVRQKAKSFRLSKQYFAVLTFSCLFCRWSCCTNWTCCLREVTGHVSFKEKK